MSDKLCPKCKEYMEKGQRLASFTTEVTLVKGQNLVGDNIIVYVCPNCGYIELYKEKLPWNNRMVLAASENPVDPHETNDASRHNQGENDYGGVLEPMKV